MSFAIGTQAFAAGAPVLPPAIQQPERAVEAQPADPSLVSPRQAEGAPLDILLDRSFEQERVQAEHAELGRERQRLEAEVRRLEQERERIAAQRETLAAQSESLRRQTEQVEMRRARAAELHAELRLRLERSEDTQEQAALRARLAEVDALMRELDSEHGRLGAQERRLAQQADDLASRQAVLEQQIAARDEERMHVYRRESEVTQMMVRLASRRFLAPHQFPPEDYTAYAIVAFPEGPTRLSRERYLKVCDIYVNTLPTLEESLARGAGLEQQMVTVWPIREEEIATRLQDESNESGRFTSCDAAVDHYDWMTAREYLQRAREAEPTFQTGQGPFLMAWAPSSGQGGSDFHVLVVDLSAFESELALHARFRRWIQTVEGDPELWGNGWSFERVAALIRDWADSFGPGIMQFFPRRES